MPLQRRLIKWATAKGSAEGQALMSTDGAVYPNRINPHRDAVSTSSQPSRQRASLAGRPDERWGETAGCKGVKVAAA